MPNRDLTNCTDVVESIRPQTAAGPVNGETVDLRGSDSVLIAVSIGAISGAAGDASVTLEESVDGTVWTDVADADILGTEPTALAADTDYQFGYRGDQRYVRAVFALGGETNVAVAAIAVRGHLSQAPAGYSTAS